METDLSSKKHLITYMVSSMPILELPYHIEVVNKLYSHLCCAHHLGTGTSWRGPLDTIHGFLQSLVNQNFPLLSDLNLIFYL